MAFAHSLLPVPMARPNPCATTTDPSPSPMGTHRRSLSLPHPFRRTAPTGLSVATRRTQLRVRAEPQESAGSVAADAFANVKHVLLPITDRNPYLSEGTRQGGRDRRACEVARDGGKVEWLCQMHSCIYAAATTTALAKKFGADITVIVIGDKPKESIPDHDTQISNIRWHLSEGGFKEFGLMERLGEAKKPTTIISEVADDLNLDLVVLSMEAIHSKHVDGNLLAEFIPCPVLLLPL